MKIKPQTTSNCDINPAFYPQIMEGLRRAEENRKNGVRGYTAEEVIARLNKIIEEAENNVRHSC